MAGLLTAGLAAAKSIGAATILSATGAGIAAAGASAAGKSRQAAMEYQADQLEAAGKADEASASQEAMEQARQTRLMQSRARAVGAASGGGIDLDLAGDIEEDGEYRKLTALWEGKEAAAGRRAQANASRFEGKQYRQAGKLKAANTILGGGTSLYEKYA